MVAIALAPLIRVPQRLQSIRYLVVVQISFGLDGIRTTDLATFVRIDDQPRDLAERRRTEPFHVAPNTAREREDPLTEHLPMIGGDNGLSGDLLEQFLDVIERYLEAFGIGITDLLKRYVPLFDCAPDLDSLLVFPVSLKVQSTPQFVRRFPR